MSNISVVFFNKRECRKIKFFARAKKMLFLITILFICIKINISLNNTIFANKILLILTHDNEKCPI